ncbi:uncharacterized protein CXorf65 homolog isoform X2 [Clytia hemisphaerica]|uniref:Uncharacterized protein n=1 Tax=Clytia hemisphaerica TaxID=252671 RepID=A0A7M5ULA2_9CNID
MFFFVHYGDTDALLLNSNCQCKILLERIKKACALRREELIDIADMQAVVQKLSDAPKSSYASSYLQYRANYVLIKIISRLSNRKVNPDAYNKESRDVFNRTAVLKNKGGRNDSRTQNQRPKASNANLSSAGGTPQRRTSNRDRH